MIFKCENPGRLKCVPYKQKSGLIYVVGKKRSLRSLNANNINKPTNIFFRYTGTQTKCLNLGSYNYLGFAQAEGPCAEAAEKAIRDYGLAMCSPVQELGKSTRRQQILLK